MEEFGFAQGWLKDDDFNPFGLDALHDALNGRCSEVIRTTLHNQTIDTYNFGFAADNFISDEIFARTVSGDDCADQRLRHVVVVGQQLLGVFGQAIATVAKAWIVVVTAYAGV